MTRGPKIVPLRADRTPEDRIADRVEGLDGYVPPSAADMDEPARRAPLASAEDPTDELGPSDLRDGSDPVDAALVRDCASFDHSDTDNGKRLIAHFGQDLALLKCEGARSVDWVVFDGTHWDVASGQDAALAMAQRIGVRIALEADHLGYTPPEKAAIDLAENTSLPAPPKGDAASDDHRAKYRAAKAIHDEAMAAETALLRRQIARRRFGVSSKNKARLENMLACAAPQLTRHPDDFNADPLRFATTTHTVHFVRDLDLECPDPDATRYTVGVHAMAGHLRSDFITKIVPVSYDPAATCPKWDAFLAEFLPDHTVRTCVQTYSGLSLLGLPLQNFLFHYGHGANGKSVFLEVLTRVFGPLAVGLPAESLTGEGQRSGQNASPDLARLHGARFVRVAELPAGEKIKEDLVKKLTGGESFPVRTLFKSFFEFKPVFKSHMSGNDYPRIDGTDEGIWRRTVVIHWPVTIPLERRRNFEDVVGEFVDEASGILNWLIVGAKAYLASGLYLPPAVTMATKEMRDELDPIGQFCADCVERTEPDHKGQSVFSVTAREMYRAYVAWSQANAKKPIFETKFGRTMKSRYEKDEGRVRRYLNVRLHDVPPNEDIGAYGQNFAPQTPYGHEQR